MVSSFVPLLGPVLKPSSHHKHSFLQSMLVAQKLASAHQCWHYHRNYHKPDIISTRVMQQLPKRSPLLSPPSIINKQPKWFFKSMSWFIFFLYEKLPHISYFWETFPDLRVDRVRGPKGPQRSPLIQGPCFPHSLPRAQHLCPPPSHPEINQHPFAFWGEVLFQKCSFVKYVLNDGLSFFSNLVSNVFLIKPLTLLNMAMSLSSQLFPHS